MYKIAVMGDLESVLSFKALGITAVIADTAVKAKKELSRLEKEDYAIIYMTEDLAVLIEDEIKKYIRYLETTGLIQKNAGGNFGCVSFKHTEKLCNI